MRSVCAWSAGRSPFIIYSSSAEADRMRSAEGVGREKMSGRESRCKYGIRGRVEISEGGCDAVE